MAYTELTCRSQVLGYRHIEEFSLCYSLYGCCSIPMCGCFSSGKVEGLGFNICDLDRRCLCRSVVECPSGWLTRL